ncbi:hypothetical protein ACPCW1_19360, partial [Bacillus pumilus]
MKFRRVLVRSTGVTGATGDTGPTGVTGATGDTGNQKSIVAKKNTCNPVSISVTAAPFHTG